MVKVALKWVQKEMKKQADSGRKKVEPWRKGDWVMRSIKDLVFKEQSVRKLVDYYMGPYTIEELVSTNVVKLKLLTTMRIYPVVNMSWVVWYQEPIKE